MLVAMLLIMFVASTGAQSVAPSSAGATMGNSQPFLSESSAAEILLQTWKPRLIVQASRDFRYLGSRQLNEYGLCTKMM